LLEGAVEVLSMAHLDDVYDELVIFNSVNDAILTLPDPIAIPAGELLISIRTRLVA
jgi:hypothetical protein